ncbi:MAG: class D beta-lactamase [Ignavibacteriae bacterium]|nr:MAG: class D beta-lactamase [Ignavibacteriota bacterium]
MKTNIIFTLLLFVTACSFSQQEKDFSKYFNEQNVDGSFLIYDMNKNEYSGYNLERTKIQFTPASTFKIFNSLTALETGAVPDENYIIKWDSVKRQIPEWNRDLNMKDAFTYSAVWFYQEIARRIGQEKMQDYIDTVGYGNKDISGGIDRFWLDGGLRISQQEQIEFLKKLFSNRLPFSQRSMDIVKNVMLQDDTPGYKLYAKTGWALRTGTDIGWWVGWVETKNNIYFFATNIESDNPTENFPAARKIITKNIFRELHILP